MLWEPVLHSRESRCHSLRLATAQETTPLNLLCRPTHPLSICAIASSTTHFLCLERPCCWNRQLNESGKITINFHQFVIFSFTRIGRSLLQLDLCIFSWVNEHEEYESSEGDIHSNLNYKYYNPCTSVLYRRCACLDLTDTDPTVLLFCSWVTNKISVIFSWAGAHEEEETYGGDSDNGLDYEYGPRGSALFCWRTHSYGLVTNRDPTVFLFCSWVLCSILCRWVIYYAQLNQYPWFCLILLADSAFTRSAGQWRTVTGDG